MDNGLLRIISFSFGNHWLVIDSFKILDAETERLVSGTVRLVGL